MLLTLPERAFEGILFSAVCSAARFYTAKTPNGHCGYEFSPNVVRRVPSRASFEEAWDGVVFLSKLLFETGRAEVSVTAEWAAQMLSADTAFS